MYIINSRIDFDTSGPKNSIEDINCWIIVTKDLFIVVKIGVEPATLLGLAENKRMVYQCSTDSLKQRLCF